ncbi:MAG: hypothetical protein ACRCS8_00905 [Brevinema sp.]
MSRLNIVKIFIGSTLEFFFGLFIAVITLFISYIHQEQILQILDAFYGSVSITFSGIGFANMASMVFIYFLGKKYRWLISFLLMFNGFLFLLAFMYWLSDVIDFGMTRGFYEFIKKFPHIPVETPAIIIYCSAVKMIHDAIKTQNESLKTMAHRIVYFVAVPLFIISLFIEVLCYQSPYEQVEPKSTPPSFSSTSGKSTIILE